MKTTRKPAARARPCPGPARWDVLVVDGKPLRKKAQREYQKAVRDLEAARSESERFHNEDKPLFDKWLAANFGALLTEIRELQLKLFDAQNLVNEVQQEYHFGEHQTIASAYRAVLHRREHPGEIEAEEEEFDAGEAEDFGREFEETFGKAAEQFWEQLGKEADSSRGSLRKAKAGKNKDRLKELYRSLARRLHPDKGRALAAKEKEWWHQTQAAYEGGNVEQLEMILTLLEVDDKGTSQASVSTLQQLTAAFKKTLRALKRQLTEFRRDIAWNFSRDVDRTDLSRQTSLSLETDRERIRWLLQKYEGQINQWKTQEQKPAARRARVRARRGDWLDEELF